MSKDLDLDAKRLLLTVAANVQRVRLAKGLSQSMLAEKSGIHRISIVRIEAGTVNLTASTLSHIAVALEVDPSLLVRPTQQSSQKS